MKTEEERPVPVPEDAEIEKGSESSETSSPRRGRVVMSSRCRAGRQMQLVTSETMLSGGRCSCCGKDSPTVRDTIGGNGHGGSRSRNVPVL